MTDETVLMWADEWTGHDPFGHIRGVDAPGRSAKQRAPLLSLPRGGYASFRLLVQGKGLFRLQATVEGGLEAELYRVWFHRLERPEPENEWHPDALIPLRWGEFLDLPDRDNGIPGQLVREFWVDVYAPPDVPAGRREIRIRLLNKKNVKDLVIPVHVYDVSLPAQPLFMLDNNSYGCRWLVESYPRALPPTLSPGRFWRTVIELLHHYYRLAHEHRMTFHNLGYGHSGEFDPIYGPRATGAGRQMRLTDWALFDRYYGPLLDGSVFRRAAPSMPPPRRAAVPLWGVYTPFNPQWPSSVIKWGTPGYETEFMEGVRQFDTHLRDRGWIHTRMELFFNHKKRYRWFEWDGDECKFSKDDAYHLRMIEMWQKAIEGSPVPWLYRVDASWRMKDQFRVLSCGRNFWVIAGFCAWYAKEVRATAARGDTLFGYGGYAKITEASVASLKDPWTFWARGLHGYCEWLTSRPGRDPWFHCDGAPHGVFYPGERFGIAGPLPSIRLKILRNALQDFDLVRSASGETAWTDRNRRMARGLGVRLWEPPVPAARTLPPEDWDYRNLAEGAPPPLHPIGPAADVWRSFRHFALRTAASLEARSR